VLVAEIIRRKRNGGALSDAEIERFVAAVTDGSASDAQIAAFGMAVWFAGMDVRECAQLTRRMRDSGATLDWRAAGLGGPLVDKHSTGGVGDLVSLVLAPLLAACGAFVPMISGRGLDHTGGTLDKLAAIPGYDPYPSRERLRACLRAAGCAIVGADATIAPADRRLYAVRDVTATVDAPALMAASILAKKLAEGLDTLVLDVKYGSGAQTPAVDDAWRLARLLVTVAREAGLATSALVTDMGEPLAAAVGNALEVRAALDYLGGRTRPPRLHAVTFALGARALVDARLARDAADAERRLTEALDAGRAAERFGRMVAALGGPRDFVARGADRLPVAPCVQPVLADRGGVVQAVDARAIGLALVELGGGRTRPDAAIDPRVGFERLVPVGARVEPGAPLAFVHAARAADHAGAAARVRAALRIGDAPPTLPPLVATTLAAACEPAARVAGAA
jgi:thymidine phosphorylase